MRPDSYPRYGIKCRRCKGAMNVWIDLAGDDVPMCFSCLKDIVEDLLGKALVAGHALVGKDAKELAERLMREDK